MVMSRIRPPAVAGLFYPKDPDELSDLINELLTAANPSPETNDLVGLVSPHAGYVYSGLTAAFGFKLLEKKTYKKIIIISPSHREYFRGITIYPGNGYETPLGIAEIDEATAEEIISQSKLIFRGEQGHGNEHAVEVQIPFLQKVLEGFKIIPIVMGDQSKIFIDELADVLSKISHKNTLIIASSDLSHFYPKQTAYELDSIIEKRILNYEADKLEEDLNQNKCEACGGGPIVALMKSAAIKNNVRAEVLHRSDSGDVSGDNKKVVGYLSAAIYGRD
jgi:MEMO1 family protein